MRSQKEIIQGCLEGDKASQYELYEMYSPLLYGICLRYLRDEDAAADMLQECFIKIFGKLNDFRGDGSFEGWLRRLTVNTILNELKRMQRQPFFDILSDEMKPIEGQVYQPDSLSCADLVRMIQQLPTGYRTVFNLYEIEGYSHQEIAQILEISESTSKTQLRNAKIKLKQLAYQLYGITQF